MSVKPKGDFLFICGCARSGTSITTELLMRHSKIAMGRERYNSLFKANNNDFIPALFNKQRFCKELIDDDSHHQRLGDYYDKVFMLWNSHRYIGDKIPSLFKQYDYLVDTFAKPKILFLLRDIHDVSQSWERRRINSLNNNDPWPHDKGFLAAITEWNMSLKNTFLAVSKHPDSILIVSYAKLFSDIEQLEKIFAFLDLDIEDETMAFWDENTLKKQMIEQKKVSIMTDDIRHSIQMDADFETYQILQTMEEEYYVKY